MSIDLSTYQSIQSNLFVRIDVQEYRTTPTGSYTPLVLRFSDRVGSYTLNGESYTGLGKLMSISQSSSEIRVSGGELTIVLSGIPNSSIAEIVNSKIKGAPVNVYRGVFNSTTGDLLAIDGNPVGRFIGFVNNYSLTEEFDNVSRTSSNTLVLTCASNVDILANKVAGRKTNPKSQKALYPSDLSMDRVPTLKGATFDFGAPQ